MTDDTTTWLKKNPGINPLRRSLKTSLRFHVNTSEMNGSIMSNSGKANEQQIILPRLLQRQSVRMKMLKANELKTTNKFSIKSNNTEELTISTVKSTEKILCPRKSFLPVKNNKSDFGHRRIPNNVAGPSFLPRSSAKKNFKRELFQKIVQTTKNNYVSENNEFKIPMEPGIATEGSIIRSILKKKRDSLKKSLKTSSGKKRPKPVKKVLFEDFENVAEDDKENDFIVFPDADESDIPAVDEPTEFLNFPKSSHLSSSPVNRDGGQDSSITNANAADKTELKTPKENSCLLELLKTCSELMENMKSLQSVRDTLTESIQVHVEQSQALQNRFNAYVKNSEQLYGELSCLLKNFEENLRKIFSNVEDEESPKGGSVAPRSAERKLREKPDKIRLSDKSKAIKRNSAKSNSAMKLGLWNNTTAESNFALVETKGVLNK